MADDYLTRTRPAPSRHGGPSLRAVMGTTLLAFVGGALLVGYLVWAGKLRLDQSVRNGQPAAVVTLASPRAAAPGETPAQAAAIAGFDQRLVALEQRLTRLDLQAAAADGNTARAEALLIAFAARRAIERGVPLGYLADQLKLRFGDAQPNAVATVIDAAARPVTLDQLAGQLDALAPVIADAPRDEGGWATFKRELSNMFVIRHDSTPSPRPEQRLDRVRVMLRTGQVDAAIAEVQRLPGAAAAADWTAAARRYAAAQRALDLIETTALLEPVRLKDGHGGQVQQPSPADPAVAAAPPAPPAPATPR